MSCIFGCTINESNILLPRCNTAAARYNVNSGFYLYVRCNFILKYLLPDSNNFGFHVLLKEDVYDSYVSDTHFSSYQSVKQLMSTIFNVFARPGLTFGAPGITENDQMNTINKMLTFVNQHRRQGVVPMYLDLYFFTVLTDDEASRNWYEYYDNRSILALLKKVNVPNGGECCAVCLDELLLGTEVLSTPCNHVFHDKCIVRWLRTNHTCPLCRYEMPHD